VATQLHAGDMTIALQPLMDDQESDSRVTTGAIYWEGAVTAMHKGNRIGRGYLELTGYAKPLRF
jgi:predicted secreted hydrolase